MNANPGVSPAETKGKVLSFPEAPAGAQKMKSSLRKYALIGASVITLMLAGAGALRLFSGRSNADYVTSEVTRGDIARSSTATGTVNPVLTVIVGTYVSGVIRNIYCDYNTRVRAGQVCAKIDPRPYQATFDQYSAQLARDQALLAKDRMNLARYQNLAAQNAISRQQAEDQAEVVKQDEATVKLDQALVDGALLNLNYTNIVSPVDGTVVSRNVTGGQTVAASFQTPTLFLIAADLKQMEVDTNTSEGEMGRIEVGDRATFTVDAYPGRSFKGTVTQVRQSPNTIQNVVTYAVVIGTTCDATIGKRAAAIQRGAGIERSVIVSLSAADPFAATWPECRAMSELGQSRRFELRPATSGLRLSTDVLGTPGRSNVPQTEAVV